MRTFLPLKNDENKCNYCGNAYSETLALKQKYCKNCLFWYIKYITDNDTYLDLHIVTNNTRCIEHEATRNTDYHTTNIQEWCEYCSDILCFIQIKYDISTRRFEIIDCNLCGKLIHEAKNKHEYIMFKLCSGCYLISSGFVESTKIKIRIPIIYLPWLDSKSYCMVCYKRLNFASDCQKWCSSCYLIYSGCRYCLTTNIIFGITNQSQCKKCKRISIIVINTENIFSGDHVVDEILDYINFENQIDQTKQIADCMNKLNNIHKVYEVVRDTLVPILNLSAPKMRWIPYSQIKNLTKIAEGGYGIIYKATLSDDETVAIKSFFNSQSISKYFLNEVIIFIR